MSNQNILKRIGELIGQYRAGTVSLGEFACAVEGHAEALEGADFHKHYKPMQEITFVLTRQSELASRPNYERREFFDAAAVEISMGRLQQWFEEMTAHCSKGAAANKGES